MVQMALFHPHYGTMGVIKQQSWGKRLQLCCASPAKELKVFLALDTAWKMHFLEICKALFRVRGTDWPLSRNYSSTKKKHQHRNASKIQVARKNMCSEEYARPLPETDIPTHCCAYCRSPASGFLHVEKPSASWTAKRLLGCTPPWL